MVKVNNITHVETKDTRHELLQTPKKCSVTLLVRLITNEQ